MEKPVCPECHRARYKNRVALTDPDWKNLFDLYGPAPVVALRGPQERPTHVYRCVCGTLFLGIEAIEA